METDLRATSLAEAEAEAEVAWWSEFLNLQSELREREQVVHSCIDTEGAWWRLVERLLGKIKAEIKAQMRAEKEVGNRDTDTEVAGRPILVGLRENMKSLGFVLRELETWVQIEAVASTGRMFFKWGEVLLLLEEIGRQFVEYKALKNMQPRRNRSLGGQEPGKASRIELDVEGQDEVAKVELDVEGQDEVAKVELDVEELSRSLKGIHQPLLGYEEPEGSKESAKRDASSSKEASKEDAGMVEKSSKVVLKKSSKVVLKGKRMSKAERKIIAKIKRDLKIKEELERDEDCMRKFEEEVRNNYDPEMHTDRNAYDARRFKKTWDTSYLSSFGRFEDTTSIPCKRYTVDPAPRGGWTCPTLQVFSVKVTELTRGLQWPINVFGTVALRDKLDHNRNIIFKCERDNCQTLTDENPYLVLTGPVRGVVFCDSVVFDAWLYARGATESDDKELSLLAATLRKWKQPTESQLMVNSYPSRHCTLEFEIGHIIYSVEATISMKVISGPPHGFSGRFVASTSSLKPEILLHISGVEEMHRTGDEINLSRSVVSVEHFGKLMVTVSALDGSVTLKGTAEFKAQEKGTSSRELHISGMCKLDITVAWSTFG